MNTKPKFFFDLEETLITDWHNPVLTNVEKVRALVAVSAITEVRIFSWAIWDQSDADKFNREMKDCIENAFGFKIIEIILKRDAIAIVAKRRGLWVDMNNPMDDIADIANNIGKDGIFTEFCFARERDCICVLVDDVVPNRTIEDHDLNVIVKLVNVNNL